ncbi:MAG: winged helix-turn-helix transcriptional regulator [Methanosphaera stadtmanae]|jgi:predicted transcriptional regulator|nr:winged helix-turn-helix transcriptional regulator [Methanosphaera stadtmanae]
MKKILRWVILGTKGGYNRAKIIIALKKRPSNTNQLKNTLNLNYKTIAHHLEVLEELGVIESSGPNYGKIYFLSDKMEEQYDDFRNIWEQLEK